MGGAALRDKRGESRSSMAHAWPSPSPGRPRRGEALPLVTLIRALIRQPALGPASPAKNRLLGHPAALADRPRPQRRWPGSSGHSRTWDRTLQPRGDRRARTLEPEPAGGSSERAGGGAAWADAAHCDLRARPTPRAQPPPCAQAPRSPRPCSSPCAAGYQAGTTQRRELYLLVSALPGPAAVAQVPSRRPAGNGRLRGGAAPHVRASRPEGPGDRPLKGTGPRSRRPPDAPRWSAETSPSAWKSLRNPFIHSTLLCLPQSALVSRDPRTKVPLGPRHGLIPFNRTPSC